MNKNIEVINENLWAVNFGFVRMKFIQEIKCLHENKTSNDYAGLNEKGVLILNKSSEFFPIIRDMMLRIMHYDDKELQIQLLLMQEKVKKPHLVNYEEFLLCMIEWEIKRRAVQKEYNEKPLYNKFSEGRGYKLWQVFKRLFN